MKRFTTLLQLLFTTQLLLFTTISSSSQFFGGAGDTSSFVTGVTGTLPIISSGGTTPDISCRTATGAVSGCLSAADWNTFNGKQAAGNYITALTGDGTASGPGSAALTLATVNSNVGSFTNANITVNAKGLITAASNGTNGTVTSVGLSVPATSIFGVTGSPVTTSGTLGLTTTGTSGGIPYFSSTSQVASSALLTANALVLGGGAGAAPTALGSLGTTTTVLHGNAAGAPTFGAVGLTTDVSGVLPIANGGTNNGSLSVTGGTVYYADGSKLVGLANGSAGQVLQSNGTTLAPSWAAAGTGTISSLTGDVTGSGTGAVATTAAATQANIATLSRSAGVEIHGTNTNAAATAGYYGEVIESIVSSFTNFPTSAQFGDLTSISVTAGDWLFFAQCSAFDNGATVASWACGISSTSGNSSTGLVDGSSRLNIPQCIAGSGACGGSVSGYHQLLSGTTTYYLKYRSSYSVATPQMAGRITAVRIH